MQVLNFLAQAGLYVTLAVTVIAALMVVTLRSIFHCALALILALLGISMVYISLHAEFLAVIQILLYVGAIMTLVIFAIMLTSNIGDTSIRQNNGQSLPAFLALAAFQVFFAGAVLKTAWKINPSALTANVDARFIGISLMQEYVFPFEIISVVLIVALVGAILIGRSDQ